MADKVILTAQIDSNIKGVAKDQKSWNQELDKTEKNLKDVNAEGKELIAETQILGVSLNGLKAGFRSAANGAKFLFSSIRVGIASTGVGLLLVAFTSLATWFTQTKKGAEALQVVFKGVGAAISVIVDRIGKFGGGIAKILTGNVKDGLKDMRDTFKGIGEEIKTDTLAMMALTKMNQNLRDSERELNVETAQRRSEIEELKLIAEDVTKTEEERLTAAKAAFKIETDLLDKRVANAEEAVRIQEKQLSISENMEEDLDKLAELEINLANIRGESFTKQIELNNKINAIEAETEAKRTAAHLKRLQEIADEKAASESLYEAQMAQAFAFEARVNALVDAEIDARHRLTRAVGSSIGAIGSLMEQGSLGAKALAITEIGANAAVGYMQGLTIAQKSAAAAGPGAALAFPIFYATQVAAIVGAVAQATQILGASPGATSIPSGKTVTGATPAPQMLSGAFTLGGDVGATEPIQAYVVADDMTNTQNKLATIRRRATI
jgi:hypothetical protein